MRDHAFGFPASGHFEVVFVTTEIYPFTPGGIGVLYGNLLKTYASNEHRVLLLNASLKRIDPFEFAEHYPDVALVNVTDVLRNSALVGEEAFKRTAHWHYVGYLAFQGLLRLRRSGITWGTVEFQDFGGLGATSLLARPCYPEFAHTRIAVRVHGPETVIRRRTPRGPWRVHAVVMDLERRAFDLADVIVVHSEGVLQELEAALDLDLSDRAVMQKPPVGQCNGITPSSGVAKRVAKAVFASKLDLVKGPETFIQAAVAAKRMGSSVRCVVLADHLAGGEAPLSPQAREDLGKLEWRPSVSQRDRHAELAESLVVIPSPFEAFCLLAYEAALLGGRPVLNRNNPAFSDATVWQDGENCWKFDGTSRDLLRVLTTHGTDALSSPLRWAHDAVPYWRRPAVESSTSPVPPSSAAQLAVVVTNYNLATYAPACFDALIRQVRRPDKVVLVDDGSADSRAFFEAGRRLSQAGIEVVEVSHRGRLGLSASRNSGFERVDADFVAFLDVDDIVDLRFFDRAMNAAVRGNAAVVVPYVGCFGDEVEVFLGSRDHVLAFLGPGHHTRFAENLCSSAFALIRTSVLPSAPYNESLRLYEDWDLWLRLAEGRARFLVDTEIGLWYRQRADGMASTGRGTVYADLALDQVRGAAVLRNAGSLEATALTDFVVQEITAPAAPVTHSDDAALAEAVARLRQVQQESAAIVGRKIVRAAVWLADLRHGRARRDEMRSQSVLSPGSSDD